MTVENIFCPRCNSNNLIKDGNNNGLQGYKCKECRRRFSYGKYVPVINQKKVKFEIFNYEDYKERLNYEKSKLADQTAREIAKMRRTTIEPEIEKYLFKDNENDDYAMIKILINTKSWGIQKLLSLIFESDDVHLTRFNIATISKNLCKNLKYSWKYIKEWLPLAYELKITRDVQPDNFEKTENRYENFQFVISRLFFKIRKEPIQQIDKIIGVDYIKNLVESKYFFLFKNINFDRYGYGYNSKMPDEFNILFNNELEYSLKEIIRKSKGEDFYSYYNMNDFIIGITENNWQNKEISDSGIKWEKLCKKVLENIKDDVKYQVPRDNYAISDLSFEDTIIECKLSASKENVLSTIIKYAQYCKKIEIWSFNDDLKYDLKNNIKDNLIQRDYLYDMFNNNNELSWYSNTFKSMDIEIYLYTYTDILGMVNNYNLKLELSAFYKYINPISYSDIIYTEEPFYMKNTDFLLNETTFDINSSSCFFGFLNIIKSVKIKIPSKYFIEQDKNTMIKINQKEYKLKEILDGTFIKLDLSYTHLNFNSINESYMRKLYIEDSLGNKYMPIQLMDLKKILITSHGITIDERFGNCIPTNFSLYFFVLDENTEEKISLNCKIPMLVLDSKMVDYKNEFLKLKEVSREAFLNDTDLGIEHLELEQNIWKKIYKWILDY